MKINNISLPFRANPMSQTQAMHIDKAIKNAKNIDIVCHNSTDRDSANSALAMWNYINSNGINARVIMSQKNVDLLGLRSTSCNIVQDDEQEKIDEVKPDIAFCVDFSDKHRIKPNIYKHIKESGKILGFDHHANVSVVDDSFVELTKPIPKDSIKTSCDYYVDATAKSATSVIYRFFEALGKNIDRDDAYDLMLGLIDDANKKGIVICDGKNGTVELKEKFVNDKNAYEVYQQLRKELSDEDINSIAKTIDTISSLTPEQESFKNSLKDKLQFSKNKKIAYVEIPPDDKTWKELGGDNVVTSAILNNFRKETLKNNPDVKIVFIFYEANGAYRLSAHSKDKILLDYFREIEKNNNINIPQSYGGHRSRGGGSIQTIDKEICHQWVQNIISCDKNV